MKSGTLLNSLIILWAVMNSSLGLSLFDDDCPDFKSSKCVALIKKHINSVDMQRARDAAESQCFASPNQNDESSLEEKSLLLNASGCFYLHSLESLLGNEARAYEARTRAQQMATFGCEHGKAQLCKLLIGFLASGIADLIDDFVLDLSSSERDVLNGAQVRRIELGRAFPRSVENQVMDMVTASTQKHLDRPIKRCLQCEVVAKNHPRKNLNSALPQKMIDLSVSYSGGNTFLSVKIYNISNKLEFKQTYSTEIIAKRYALFGYNAISSRDMLRARRLEEYQPITKITFGLGLQKMKNIAGGPEEEQRLVMELRSVERFNHRRSEFGLLGQYQMTSSLVKKNAGGEDKEIEVTGDEQFVTEPYRTALGIWGIYSHMLMKVGTGYDSIRNGVHGGVGFFANSFFQTWSLRAGWDLYIARSWMTSLSIIYLGPAEIMLKTKKLQQVPDVGGAQFVLSYHF